MEYWTKTASLETLVKDGIISLDRGRVISSIDLAKSPGNYPVYSSSAQKNGHFGSYDLYDFDEELITWSVDGGGYFFYRPKHKFSVTNVSGIMRITKSDKYNYKFLYYLLVYQHKNQIYDYVDKAHPSVIKKRYFIPEISFAEQITIASILSKVDVAISQTEQLIAKYSRIKTGLMQDLLIKGIDEHGTIRSEETHEFKDSPLGRIPKDWIYCRVEDALTLQRGFDITTKDLSPGKIPIVSSSGTTGYHNKFMSKGPGVITGRKGTIGKVYFIESDYWPHDTTLWVKDFKNNEPFFIYYLLNSINLKQFEASTANPTLNRNAVHPHPVIIPGSNIEQEKIAGKINSFSKIITEHAQALEKLKVLKTGLMQDLLSGKVRVNHMIDSVKTKKEIV